MNASIPVVRHPSLDFTGLRMDWFASNLSLSVQGDALHLLFPSGERFFVRSVAAYKDEIDDPALLARVRGFAGQEAMHGRMHETAFEALEAQGLEIRSAVAAYERVAWGWLEPIGTRMLCLSTTAALEHLTASFAVQSLEDGRIDAMDPPMRDMMRWHAAEEIEHRDVAFDVMQAMGGGWLVRVLGMAIALVGLVGFWLYLWWHLSRQVPALTWRRTLADRREVFEKGWGHGFVVRDALRYLRPGFHPTHDAVDHLLPAALEGLGETA